MAPPFATISTFVDQNPGHGTRNLGVRLRLLLSLSSVSARSAGDRTLFLNKLQQLFYTLSVSQDFSLFLDLTYSLNVLSITCILCKTVTSTSRTLVIT